MEERKFRVTDEVLAIIQVRQEVSATAAARAAVADHLDMKTNLSLNLVLIRPGEEHEEKEKEEQAVVVEKKGLGFRSWLATELEIEAL